MEKGIRINKEAQLYRLNEAAKDLTLEELTALADMANGVAFMNRLLKEKRGENVQEDSACDVEKLLQIAREYDAEDLVLRLAGVILQAR